ncbi:protein cramped [Sitophilus oryzae]|uniref:Protein cramped n=1 Tax=Sitophilus oryzae TaxID=7048 RepID=A0A6J2XH73_SITOR|nr:protein cramped [Sitophilus oryzae]
MDVDSPIEENSKKICDNLTNSLPEGPLLGSITTNALDKDDKGMQIRSSARVFKKMKLEQELDKKNDEKSTLDCPSGCISGEASVAVLSPNAEPSHSNSSPVEKPPDPEIKGPQIRSSTRVIKKTKLDSTIVSDTKPKKDEVKADIKKIVRTNWSYEDKLMFFEAVNEYGKDFENILQYINTKLKKRGATDEQIKTKDHVRQFYNRTFHEVSKHVKFSDSVKKVVQELYGIINYGELHKKLGSISDKACLKLTELIYRGATVIRSKGKTIRIKSPMCRALIKISQLDENYEDVKLPNRVIVELRPKDMTSFVRIQSMAQNPRLKTTLPLQKRLNALIQCLSKRWKTRDVIEYEKSIVSSNPVTNDCVPSQQEIVDNLALLSPALRLSPPPESKIDLPLINLSDYLTRQTICLTAYERRIGLDTFSEIKIMSKKKKQKVETEQKIDVPLQDVKPDFKCEIKNEETEANSCNEADPDVTLADVVDDAITSIVLLQQRLDRQTSETSETDEPTKSELKEEIKSELKSEVINKEQQEKIENIRKGWTEKNSCSLTIGELYLMYGSDSTLVLEYSWDTEAKTATEKPVTSEEHFLDKWKETYQETLENKKKNLTTALTKLLSIVKLQHRNNVMKCQCGHICDGRMVIKNGPTGSFSRGKRGSILETNIPENLLPSKSQNTGFASKPVYVQPKDRTQQTPTMKQQLDSIQKLKPIFCNRKGRRFRSKQVVVERKLPLLPNNLSGHQIVRMNIISQQPSPAAATTESQISIQDDLQIQKVIDNPEDENSVISTVPSSPSRLLKEGESEWINAEVADYSLSSLLGHLESPIKNPITTSMAANLPSDLSNEVDAQLHSLLTENSVDFAANFADLAASVVNDKKY